MDKATPTPPATVDSFMSLLRNHENRISETYGVLQDRKIPSEEVRAAIDASSEARNALIAEVERLAAQAAPTGLTDMGWVIDAATKGELAAYDQGSAECQQAVTKILDGKDTGAGTANPPWEPLRRRLIALVAQAPVVQAGDMRSYLDFVLEPRHINGEVSAVEYEQALIELRLLRDRASSGAAQAAPRCVTCDGTGEVHRADGTWVGTCFCAEGKRAATTQAVRMLTDGEIDAITDMHNTGRSQGAYDCAIELLHKFCAVNANRTIPADGKIGGAA